MTTDNKVPYGKPDAGNPHALFDEGKDASAKPRRVSLLCNMLKPTVALALTLLASVTLGANTFRVTPYVQHPSTNAMTVMWLAATNGNATIEYWKAGTNARTTLSAVERSDLSADISGIRFKNNDQLEYCLAPELGYGMDPDGGNDGERGGGWDMPCTVPYQYRVRLTGLEPDTEYRYRVQLTGGDSYENRFRTSPDPAKWRGFKFIYYSDSETEPADNDPGGKTSDWTIPPGSPRTTSTYCASQTRAYASNICAAVDFGTELIVMAGDLAQRGSRQCDWDEFWRHNAGPLNDPAGSIPILASPGNHDYWSYVDDSVVGPRKYLSYFEYEQNDAAGMDDDQRERFHRVDYGPVTFIFLDGNNGDDSDKYKDTNRYISRAGGCRAPDFNPGSPQYEWLERQLADAQRKSAFTFIVTHQCPFSVGYHGRDADHDDLSGRPLRVWLPILHKYGVDGWFAGHDEMMERSVTEGTETLPNGQEVPHSFNVWDMGIAGDGLRGDLLAENPYQRYRASIDSPEVYENGLQVEGGVHYGQLQVTIDQTEDGRWRATFDPVYLFFTKDGSGNLVYGGVRHYGDKQVRISNRNAGTAPAPTPVTEPRVDVSTRVPGKMPQGLLTTFWNGPLSRGFSWQTDTSVTETKLWLLEGEYDQDDGNTFVANGTLYTGEITAVTTPPMNVHRAHCTGLTAGRTYSYRLGGNGYYVYGRFTVKDDEPSVTAVTFSDTQTKDATLLYKAENTLSVASRTAGPDVDLVVSGGDIFNLSALNNANHVIYGANVPNGYYEWSWGLMADLLAPYFPGIPWITVPGNHDYQYYRKLTAVDYYTTGMNNAGCSSVDIGNVHFAEIPFLGAPWSGSASQYQAAFSWLQQDLAASRAQWKVVCVHWGPYTTGDHGTGINLSEGVVDYVHALTPILSANHVDLVIQAHDHTFSKSVPYRWDTLGYTSSSTDSEVLNLSPASVSVDGELFDFNPQGTYYVSAGCAGHRAAEEPTYPTSTGVNSYTKRDPRIVMGKIAVNSRFRNAGDEATGDFADIDPNGFQMFGLLKVRGNRLVYEFYVAEADGSATLVDVLRVCKGNDTTLLPAKMVITDSKKAATFNTSWPMSDGVFGAGSFDFMPTKTFVMCDFGAPRTLKMMKAGYAGASNKDRIPGSILYVSNDKATWTQLYQIPTGSDYNITSWDCDLPEHEPVRYAWFSPNRNDNCQITELQFFAEGPAIELEKPILWDSTTAVDAPLPSAGVKVSGTLRAGDGLSRHLVAFAADTDYADSYADWTAHAAGTIDFGTIAAGASFEGYFAGLKRGLWQWRVFAVENNAAVAASEPGQAFNVGTKAFTASVYVSTSGAVKAVDGRINGETPAGNAYAIFDLRTIPEGYRLAGLRFWPRGSTYGHRASNGELKFLTPKASFDWQTYVTSVVTNKTSGRITSVISGYPESDSRIAGEPITVTYKSSYTSVGESPISADEVKDNPPLLYFTCNRLDVQELELRIAKIPRGLSIMIK